MEHPDHWFARTQETPPNKRSTNVFDHQIFFSETLPGRRLRGDASERAALPPEAQRRWDYFYRPDMSALDEVDADELNQIKSVTGIRGAAFRAYLLSLPVVVVAALGAGLLFDRQVGLGTLFVLFVSVTIAAAVVLLRYKLSDRQDAIVAFRRAIAAGIEEAERSRPEEHAMRAYFAEAFERNAAPIQESVDADPSALASFTGWSATSPAIRLLSETQHNRAFARAGTLFALTDVMLVYAENDRLHVNRYAFDVIEERVLPLEEWSLKRDGLEIGRRTQRKDLPPFPFADAPLPCETNPDHAPLLPNTPVHPLTVRELVIAAPSLQIGHRLADAKLFNDIETAEMGAIKALEAQATAIARLVDDPRGDAIDLDLQESMRKTRLGRLVADAQAIHEERQTKEEKSAIDALRRIVYAQGEVSPRVAAQAPAATPPVAPPPPTPAPAPAPAPEATASATPFGGSAEPSAEPAATEPKPAPTAPKKPLHDLY